MSLRCRLALLVVIGVCWADQQKPQSQALRSFNDGRQDKFNGNYEPLDGMGPSSRSRVAYSPAPPMEPVDYNHQPSRVRPQPLSSPNSRYGYDEDVIHRFGDVASYDSSYASPANRKTFSGQRTGNLALVVSPLAGIAFIAAAAAVAVSPVYLTISSSLLGRKKRDLLSMIDPSISGKVSPDMVQKIQELQTLEKFLASIPKETDYQKQIMSMYLSCSGYTQEDNLCLDRVFCEYGDADSAISEEERDVLSIVLYNIMSNDFVPDDYKKRLRTAARVGRDFKECFRYTCPALAELRN